ncbi:MAG: hypothetical protein NC924_05595 [Candidatus Omnitrophica bacterium]|nr:hypothetical protein [Candidatus Omnitrophota bacterium]
MEFFKKLQALTLKLIILLVWFDLLCFSLILAGNIFQWSFFNESIGSAFYTMFGVSLGALAALAALHVVLTLNIISDAISALAIKTAPDPEDVSALRRRFQTILSASLAAIILIVGYQGTIERNAARHKATTIARQLADAAQSTLTTRISALISEDAPISKLYFVRDELLLSLENQRGVTLLLPKTGENTPVFYQITPWDFSRDDQTNISKSLNSLFVPQDTERKQFQEMIETQKPFFVINRHTIRVFQPIIKNNEISLILLLDTNRSVSDDYLMSRRKL